MKPLRLPALSSLLAMVLAVGGAAWPASVPVAAAAPAGCQLSAPDSSIQHVIYLQFDNTHYMRDNSSVASDLEQMPHLLDFLTQNGTLFTNDHTILISHTAGGILSTQTGLYPDRHGIAVSNSYGYFPPSRVPAFSSAFKYWTDLVDDNTGLLDPFANMITDGQKNTPAPWVPYTRDGCDFGAVSLANIELENTGTGPNGDMTKVFGMNSPEWLEAQSNPSLALTDFVGIAIHCASGGGICNGNMSAKADQFPDEPGGYSGFSGLFGAKYVNPAINGGSPSVNNMFGQPITDPQGRPGFPGFDGASAANTLGYMLQMQKAGIPVTFGYIS